MWYYVEVLTEGALVTLNEAAKQAVSELSGYAEFVPTEHDTRLNLMRQHIRAKWLNPDFWLPFELANYVLPFITIEIWKANGMHISGASEIDSEPIILRGGLFQTISSFEDVFAYVEKDAESDAYYTPLIDSYFGPGECEGDSCEIPYPEETEDDYVVT